MVLRQIVGEASSTVWWCVGRMNSDDCLCGTGVLYIGCHEFALILMGQVVDWHYFHVTRVNFIKRCQPCCFSAGFKSRPVESSEHLCNAACLLMIIADKSCGSPLDFLNILDMLFGVRVPDRCGIFYIRADQHFVSFFSWRLLVDSEFSSCET